MLFTTTNLCPQADIKGTLLTQSQVEVISSRISKNVERNVNDQLKKALSKKTNK